MLLEMRYDGQICFDAASKYPNNMSMAIDYIEKFTEAYSISQNAPTSNKISQINLIPTNEEKKDNVQLQIVMSCSTK